MRIIAGAHRGRRIAAPKGRDTRPTSDRVRENAFNLIGPVDDADVLDLYAGSGALGLEALSRGAASRDLRRVRPRGVPHDQREPRQARPARAPSSARTRCARSPASAARYDLILCDPPYDYDRSEARAAPGAPAAEDGLLVYETSGRAEQPEVPGLEVRTSRKYGSARLTLFEP